MKKIKKDLSELHDKVDRLQERQDADKEDVIRLEVGIRALFAELYARIEFSAASVSVAASAAASDISDGWKSLTSGTSATSAATGKHPNLGHLVQLVVLTVILSRY